MRLTSFTDYGLRALMLLAASPTQGLSSAELAMRLGLSRHHLTKIMQRLAKGGIVATRRGGGGGAALAHPAETLHLGQIVRLLESGQALVECLAPGEGTCSILPACRLRSRLVHAEAAFLADLDRSTLADIAMDAR